MLCNKLYNIWDFGNSAIYSLVMMLCGQSLAQWCRGSPKDFRTVSL